MRREDIADINEHIDKVLALYDAHHRVYIENYEPRMEQLLHELLDMAIVYTDKKELIDKFDEYHSSIRFMGIIEEERYRIFSIISDIMEMIDKK